MELGPVQIVVIGLGEAELVDELLPELRRLREMDAVRLVDLVLLNKDEEGRLTRLHVGRQPPTDSVEFGDLVEPLVGLGRVSEQGVSVGAGAGAAAGTSGSETTQTWAVSDAIPPGTTAAVVLIEHRWAIPLRSAVVRAGGFALEDTWVNPLDLIATGACFPVAAERHGTSARTPRTPTS